MRIVILGSSFAGAYCAQALEKTLRGLEVEVLLVDRNNYFIFYPLLIEAGTGSLEPRHAVVSIRSFLRTAVFRMGEVLGFDLEHKIVRCRFAGLPEEQRVSYDHLVIALGSVTNLPPVPGLREYGYEVKSLADAVALRDRAIRMLERADAIDDPARRRHLLHFVVVGANFTGIEVAGEFQMFLRQASRSYRRIDADECRVTLVELSNRVLGALDAELGEYAAEHLRRRGVDIRLGTTVARVEQDHVMLQDGERLDASTLIWCAGIAPAPVLAESGLPRDERGYVRCARDLRVEGHDDVWAVGDCAVNPDREGKPYPATAQHAVRQGVHLAGNLARVLRGREALPCDLVDLGSLAALGCRTGVAKVFGIKLAGFPAWFLWRTVYLYKMPGWPRRIRIALDWTMDLFFRRDYVQLGVHRAAMDRTVE